MAGDSPCVDAHYAEEAATLPRTGQEGSGPDLRGLNMRRGAGLSASLVASPRAIQRALTRSKHLAKHGRVWANSQCYLLYCPLSPVVHTNASVSARDCCRWCW